MKKNVKDYSKRRRALALLAGVFGLLYITVIVYHTYKPLPEGIAYEGGMHNLDNIEFLYDLSFAQDQEGTGLEHELVIFEEVYSMIEQADDFIVLDFFLFNSYISEDKDFPEIAQTLTERLVAKKEEDPDFPIYFITDRLNTGYDSYLTDELEQLEDAGVEMVYTELDPLRDSTPLYSGLYRIFFQWFANDGRTWLPNGIAEDAPDMSLPSYLELANIKANHRKVIISDGEALVTSANPHNESGFHNNMAFKVSGPIINDMLEAEEAVSLYSGGPEFPRVEEGEEEGPYQAQYLTEGAIFKALLEDIANTQEGDRIWLAMFYLSERDVVNELIDAANRGVEVRMILDPNENAFGNEKTGLPNRPVVHEMRNDSDENQMEIRWYNTTFEQFHAKTIMIESDDEMIISAGATNFTDRALNNYNLENNLRILAPLDSELAGEVNDYFNRLWDNEDALYTLHADEYQNTMNFFQRGIYGFQTIFKLTTY
ncbi:MAG TPA: phospholipase D family protein [Planococcus sp. (in: firmicutes)]|nr:phospholipase D family protein [Planococcus sp. (in: firmicutes)]